MDSTNASRCSLSVAVPCPKALPPPVESSIFNSGLNSLTYGLVLVFVILLLFFNFSTAFWTVMGVPVAFGIGLISASVCYNISINIIV